MSLVVRSTETVRPPSVPTPPGSLFLARLRRSIEGCESCAIMDIASGKTIELDGAMLEEQGLLLSFLTTELGSSSMGRTLESAYTSVFGEKKRAATTPYWVLEHGGKWLLLVRYEPRPNSVVALLCSRQAVIANVLGEVGCAQHG